MVARDPPAHIAPSSPKKYENDGLSAEFQRLLMPSSYKVEPAAHPFGHTASHGEDFCNIEECPPPGEETPIGAHFRDLYSGQQEYENHDLSVSLAGTSLGLQGPPRLQVETDELERTDEVVMTARGRLAIAEVTGHHDYDSRDDISDVTGGVSTHVDKYRERFLSQQERESLSEQERQKTENSVEEPKKVDLNQTDTAALAAADVSVPSPALAPPSIDGGTTPGVSQLGSVVQTPKVQETEEVLKDEGVVVTLEEYGGIARAQETLEAKKTNGRTKMSGVFGGFKRKSKKSKSQQAAAKPPRSPTKKKINLFRGRSRASRDTQDAALNSIPSMNSTQSRSPRKMMSRIRGLPPLRSDKSFEDKGSRSKRPSLLSKLSFLKKRNSEVEGQDFSLGDSQKAIVAEKVQVNSPGPHDYQAAAMRDLCFLQPAGTTEAQQQVTPFCCAAGGTQPEVEDTGPLMRIEDLPCKSPCGADHKNFDTLPTATVAEGAAQVDPLGVSVEGKRVKLQSVSTDSASNKGQRKRLFRMDQPGSTFPKIVPGMPHGISEENFLYSVDGKRVYAVVSDDETTIKDKKQASEKHGESPTFAMFVKQKLVSSLNPCDDNPYSDNKLCNLDTILPSK